MKFECKNVQLPVIFYNKRTYTGWKDSYGNVMIGHYDHASGGQKPWILDIAMDSRENPVLLYVRFPDDSNHIYSYARVEW